MDQIKNDQSLNNIQPKVIHILERYKFYITIFIMVILIVLLFILNSIYSFFSRKFKSNYKSKSYSNLGDHIVFQIISVLTIIFGFYAGLLSIYNSIIKEIKNLI